MLFLSFLFFTNKCIWWIILLFSVRLLRSQLWCHPKAFARHAQLHHRVNTWRRNIFCYFQFIVHIKTSTCYIVVVYFYSFFLRSIQAISDYTSLVEMLDWRLVLRHIPRDIFMVIVFENSSRWELIWVILRIVHSNKFNISKDRFVYKLKNINPFLFIIKPIWLIDFNNFLLLLIKYQKIEFIF